MTVIFAWLLADFLAGFVHWYQDKILMPSTRFSFINSVIADNDLHHSKPMALLTYTFWQNINTSVVIAWPASIALWLVGAPTVLWLAVFFASFGNLVHRFAHSPRHRLPLIVQWLQVVGLFSSFRHHAVHHFVRGRLLDKHATRFRYCPMTNWVNPVLDSVDFWHRLERLVK